MTSTDELGRFVNEALARGAPRSQIDEALLKAGWSPAQTKTALDAFADVAFPIPVPKPRAYVDAREAFLYVVLFTTMYLCAVNAGNVLFELIDHAFPGPALRTTLREAIRWSISVIVVALPVFLYTSRLVGNEIRQDPGKRASEIRRKLTYLTLFVSACALLGVLAGLVYGLLGGELTSRFLLKALAAAAIAGAVFGYYLKDMRLDAAHPRDHSRRYT